MALEPPDTRRNRLLRARRLRTTPRGLGITLHALFGKQVVCSIASWTKHSDRLDVAVKMDKAQVFGLVARWGI